VLFSSFPFILGFLPLALAGFLLCARIGPRAGGLWLILASLAFYAYWRISFLPLLLISIAFNYTISLILTRTERRPRVQTAVLVAGVSGDLLALFYFKYTTALFAWFGIAQVGGFELHDIILPLGISFFTFTQIGYLVDVKQGVAKNRDPLSFVLFVTFFPHLIAGPILHNREMMPQFADRKTYHFSGTNIAVGLTIFLIGLAKKTLFADPLASTVAASFAQPGTAGLTTAWLAAVGYSLQLYFDFSGYSDMAIGLARMFNLRFPANFNSPYKATTVIDYWQRWHMTLTRFITMYIYSPLALWVARRLAARGRDSSKRAATTPSGFSMLVLFPTLTTMGLAGVWHGAGSQYLIFGLLHGVYIATNHAVRLFLPVAKKARSSSRARIWCVNAAKVLAVYLAVLVGFVFFRAGSTADALHLLAGMIGLHGIGPDLRHLVPRPMLLLFVIVWVCPNTQQIMSRYEPVLGRAISMPYPRLAWRADPVWAVAIGTVAALSLLALGGTTEFLYFQF
jgi:D-alanyl-lipoteichoic acid acyltransferase DltB (MBOAT superfamily)